MASHAFQEQIAPLQTTPRVYSICCFDRGLLVPRVQLLEAATDEEAVSEARSMHRNKSRELWHRHRLIAVLPAEASWC